MRKIHLWANWRFVMKHNFYKIATSAESWNFEASKNGRFLRTAL
jgi:hypothetical protein